MVNFVTVGSITNSTIAITARYAGQILRLGGVDYTSNQANTQVRAYGTGSVQLGEGYWDDMIVVAGVYNGPYFDGEVPDGELVRFEWTGAPNNSTSIMQTRQHADVPETDEEYEERVRRGMRKLHGVTAISGPLIERTLHSGDAWGYLVEFTLAAATPWVFSDTYEVELAALANEVVQDVPFNLLARPSAEIEGGAPIVVATNYSTNPSAETNATGWAAAADGTVITAGTVVLTRATDLFSVGAASAKATFTATGSGSSGWFGVDQTVTLPTTTGIRFSVNMWTSSSTQTGSPTLGTLEIHAIWQNAGSTTLRDDLVGTVTGSGAASLKSALPPAGTTKVIVRAMRRVTSFTSGNVINVYADALAVSVP